MRVVGDGSWRGGIGSRSGNAIVALAAMVTIVLAPDGAAAAAEQGRVAALSTRELVDCLRSDAHCRIEEWVIREEMSRRKEVALLTSAYVTSTDEVQKDRLAEVLFEIDDLEVSRFMRALMTPEATLRGYYAAQYLAQRGDRRALSIMNQNYFKYPVSSAAWASTVQLFGKYRYRPAISHLIESIDAASVNVAAAAVESLQLLFPGSPSEFKSAAEAKKYFRERVGRQP
ncbi:MAG: hypothetical protein HYV93_10090 [Candidatus Rokubacteria bacterium]|nr:hypothetical protein [Candidatus Rokubacteria bacterium]